MLSALSIRDIVLISALDLEFDRGLSVLTGETGAGKSILLDSLSLALGARGEGGLVREGQPQGHVTAVFHPPIDHEAFRFLQENDLEAEEGEIILRRVQGADGRTRAHINSTPVSASLLRQLGRLLVEIHGQHDERALVEASHHRDLLDVFGGLEADVEQLQAAHEEWQEHRRALAALERRIAEARKEADYLKSASDELQVLAPVPGEEEELAILRQTMMASEKVASDVSEGIEALAGSASPVPEISSLVRRLERKSGDVSGLLDPAIAHIDRALDALADAQSALESAQREMAFDPHELESTEERLFALRAAARKYNVPTDRLAELSRTMLEDLAELDAGEGQLKDLAREVELADAKVVTLSAQLSTSRRDAAVILAEKVMAELPALKLEAAEFIVHIESDDQVRSAEGFDIVEFWVRTNPGTKAGPIMKIASGGELSRFLLALKVALADRGSAPTLVFDEIDAGVGGAVADAIGSRLARLSDKVQVLSVTHAPQVAARADGHFLIAKDAEDNGKANGDAAMRTGVESIAGDRRQEEIARMLAGASVTDEARAAARRLLSGDQA
ncbi:MAG: DNA repair protein RecN [Pseudomonadota bacterium]